jgi:hypothetical protein
MTKNIIPSEVTGIDMRKALLAIDENPNDYDLNFLLETARDPQACLADYTRIELWLLERIIYK